MFSTKLLAAASPLLSLIAVASAVDFNSALKTNVAMYYGSGPNENLLGGLEHFCAQSNSPDVIPLGFINRYLAQGNGYPGSNFAASCYAEVYSGPGYPTGTDVPANNHLFMTCPSISNGIASCQQAGKKILLSLGGEPIKDAPYSLTSKADGVNLANFLWGAFGPANASWTGPRPFDYNGVVNVVDGFDFDIETIVSGEQQYYIAMIQQLRTLYDAAKISTGKTYYISGAPQCAQPDTNMSDMIFGAKFDMLFVQYYNTLACSARQWVTKNPNYNTTKSEVARATSGFTFDSWVNALNAAGSQSVGAKIYIGLLGSTDATLATTPGSFYLYPTEVQNLIQSYFCRPNFGGVMIWEAAYAEDNKNSVGNTFYQAVKVILNTFSTDSKDFTCVISTTTSVSSTTTSSSTSIASSTSTTKTSSSTTSSSTSSSVSPTSTTKTSSSTTKSSSSSVLPPSTSKTSSSATSSSVNSNSTTSTRTSLSATFTSSSSSLISGVSTSTEAHNEHHVSTGTSNPRPTFSGHYSNSSATHLHATTSTAMHTSTVRITKTYTITSCAATVTDCPGRIGQVTTEIVDLYTTVCPVSAVPTTSSVPETPGSPQESEEDTTSQSTSTEYHTVTVPSPSYVTQIQTMSVVPIPVYSTPSAATSSPAVVGVVPSGTGSSGPVGTGALTSPATPAFTGAAAKSRFSAGLVSVVAVAFVMMMR